MRRSPGGFDSRDLDEAVMHGAAALRALDGASIFMTGGTGFFGRWLLATLAHGRTRLSLRTTVTVLTRRPGAFVSAYPDLAADDEVRLVAGDVRSFHFPPGRFSHMIHAATDTSVAADGDPGTLTASIVDGTRRIIDHAAQCGAERLLYVSSGAVYGPQRPDLSAIPEQDLGAPAEPDPPTAYGRAKRMAEQLCTAAALVTGLQVVIARPFAVVGPGLPLDAHFAIGNFIRDALAGRDISVKGDGRAERSYLYAADLAAWLLTMLTRGQSGRAYNAGADRAISIGELARLVASVVPGQGKVIIGGRPDPNLERTRYIPCIERARTELGLDVWTGLEEAVQRTARRAAGIEATCAHSGHATP